jgi:predicted ArsR family transcriptional regulator
VPSYGRNRALEARVLQVLRDRGPLTALAIGEVVGLDRLPIRGALAHLKDAGLVRIAGYSHDDRNPRQGGIPGIWEAVPDK